MSTTFETHWAMPAAVYVAAKRWGEQRGKGLEEALAEATRANSWVRGAALLLIHNRGLRESIAKRVERGVLPPHKYLKEAEEALRSVG
ncbi:MAG: hypothetical protein NZ902_00470 [Acidilobaceae archaeon]|nr:hypothetical protein [Acidilobaceae archaeon]MCX8165309.1 hypothetical protein [Acidilobaceae archaeon]MDW7973735.1 hypothetical protein [Sulfolobales archaeon]